MTASRARSKGNSCPTLNHPRVVESALQSGVLFGRVIGLRDVITIQLSIRDRAQRAAMRIPSRPCTSCPGPIRNPLWSRAESAQRHRRSEEVGQALRPTPWSGMEASHVGRR